MSHGGVGEHTGGPRRWAQAIAVTAAVAPLLAGLPLLELALADDQAPPAIQVPVGNPPERSAPGRVTLEPAEGWSHAASPDGSTRLRSGAATFTIEVRDGADCARSEMAEVAEARTDDPAVPLSGRAYATSAFEGTVRTWTGPTTEGLLFTSCEDGLALAAVARGPEGSLSGDGLDAVAAMLESMGAG